MRYINAWVVRVVNRILLITVAAVTVMWMVFLLNMNAASVHKTRLSHRHLQHKMPSDSEEFNDFDDSDLNNHQRAADAIEEPYNPRPALQNPPLPKPVVQKSPDVLEQAPNAEKPIQLKSGKRNLEGGKQADARPPIKHVQGVDDNMNEGMQPVPNAVQKPTGASAKVADSKSLTKFTLKDLKSMPPLPFSKTTHSSCFCANNGPTSDLQISAEDASLLGCPKRADLQLRCMPKFFLAGCNNCGVTDLQYRLNKHQLITFGTKKEPDFWIGKFATKFGGDDSLDNYTLKQYGDDTKLVLDAVRRGKKLSQPLIGEMAQTLYYSMIGKWGAGGPTIPTVIKRVIPNAKFIFLLRNPVERSTAMYNAIPNPSSIPKSPEDFDKTVKLFLKWYDMCTVKRKWDPRLCLYGKANSTERIRPAKFIVHDIIHSVYHIAIKEWIRVFSKDNILVLTFEEYMENRLEMIENKILPFLGVKSYTKGPREKLEASESDKALKYETVIKTDASQETRNLLTRFFDSQNKKLSALLGDDSFTWT